MDEGSVLLEDEKKPSKRGRKPSGKKNYRKSKEKVLLYFENIDRKD